MSGIFGVFDSRQKVNIQILMSQIGAKIRHKDWHVIESYSNQAGGIGFGRKGIGIFNRGSQPIWNSKKTVAVVMAGELFETEQMDGIDSRLPDEYIVMDLYERYGEQFIAKINGVFILAIWDGLKKRLLIANDRFGLYPLYYAHFNGRLIFSPEMKGILCDPEFKKEIDLRALSEYMRFQHLLGDKTFFEDLKLLRNATLLRYNLRSDKLEIKSYWDFAQIPELPKSITFEDAVEESGRLLKVAVDQQTLGGYRNGVYLSAGLDSRVILGLIDRGRFPITTVTYGKKDCRDVIYAQRIAKQIRSDHHTFEFRNGHWVKEYADQHLDLTEGFHSWIHSHGINVMDQVRPIMDLNLTGFGGGQSAIDWEDAPLLYSKDDYCFNSRLFNLLSQNTTWPSLDDAEERLLYSPKYAREMDGLAYDSFLEELALYDHLPYYQRAAYFALRNPDRRLFQYFTIFHRAAFEQRFPFYDYDYFKFVYALPPEMLFKRRLRRGVVLDRLKHLSKIPYDKDNLPITNNDLTHMVAKVGNSTKSYVNRHLAQLFPDYPTLYADYENWLRGELREWGEEILLGERSLSRGFFNPHCLRSLWNRHQSGLEVNMIGKVAPIMTFEMLMRKFIDEWESGTSSKDPKPLKAAEYDPWVIRKELNELGIESPGSSKDIS
ncbi:MAG: asparagine synthase-related protein [Anaerolineales bacterium]